FRSMEPDRRCAMRRAARSGTIFSISPLAIGTVPNRRSAFLNERRSLDGSACAARYGRLRATWDDLHQPSAVKSSAMAGRIAIGLRVPIRSRGIGRGAPQALQAGLPSVLEADSINLAAAAMVTGANCRLAQAHISGGTSKAG